MSQGLPAPGSQVQGLGQTWMVVAHTRQGVLLQSLSSGESRTVPSWEWPPDWLERRGIGRRERPVFEAMLIGGASGRHAQRLIDQALPLGVRVEYHQPLEKKTKNLAQIPRGVDLVVFLRSHAGHGAYETYKPRAKARRIPLLLVDSAGFQEALRAQLEQFSSGGLLPGAQPSDYERFGAEDGPTVPGWWEHNGSQWIWRERDADQPEQRHDSLLAGLLGALSLAAAAVLG